MSRSQKELACGAWGGVFNARTPKPRRACSTTDSENPVSVVDHKAVGMIKGQELSNLLGDPFGGGVLGYVEVQDLPRIDLYRDEYPHGRIRASMLQEQFWFLSREIAGAQFALSIDTSLKKITRGDPI